MLRTGATLTAILDPLQHFRLLSHLYKRILKTKSWVTIKKKSHKEDYFKNLNPRETRKTFENLVWVTVVTSLWKLSAAKQ